MEDRKLKLFPSLTPTFLAMVLPKHGLDCSNGKKPIRPAPNGCGKNLTAAVAEAEETQINVTHALSHISYGNSFHAGGVLDFTEGSASLGALKQSLPGVKVFLSGVELIGFNVKASVVNELLKDVTTIGGNLEGHDCKLSFANGDSDLELASFTSGQGIIISNNDGYVDSTICKTAAALAQGCKPSTGGTGTKAVTPNSISFPELASVPGTFYVHTNPHLRVISMPKLKSLGTGADLYVGPLLTTLDLRSLVVVAGDFRIYNNPSLATSGIQVSKDFLECDGSVEAGYGYSGSSRSFSGLECTEDNGLKALVAAAKATSNYNPQSCK